MESSRVRLVVEVEPGKPVCGSVAREGKAKIRFEGMLGFLSVFERLLCDEDAQGPQPGEGSRSRIGPGARQT
jgi:hypothetical protein